MALMAESGCLEQVDRGADNPTSYYTNYHETRKGGQGPDRAVAPVIIIIRNHSWWTQIILGTALCHLVQNIRLPVSYREA
jgi:hypothetical protein